MRCAGPFVGAYYVPSCITRYVANSDIEGNPSNAIRRSDITPSRPSPKKAPLTPCTCEILPPPPSGCWPLTGHLSEDLAPLLLEASQAFSSCWGGPIVKRVAVASLSNTKACGLLANDASFCGCLLGCRWEGWTSAAAVVEFTPMFGWPSVDVAVYSFFHLCSRQSHYCCWWPTSFMC